MNACWTIHKCCFLSQNRKTESFMFIYSSAIQFDLLGWFRKLQIQNYNFFCGSANGHCAPQYVTGVCHVACSWDCISNYRVNIYGNTILVKSNCDFGIRIKVIELRDQNLLCKCRESVLWYDILDVRWMYRLWSNLSDVIFELFRK